MIKTFLSVHQNHSGNKESLLFQFIIFTYLCAKEKITILQRRNEELATAIEKGQLEKLKIQELSKSISHLSGSSCESQPFSFTALDTGSISKLKNYCLLFLLDFHKPLRLAKQLKTHAENLWLESRELHNYHTDFQVILSFLNLGNSPVPKSFQNANKTIAKLNKSIIALGQVLLTISKKFHNDENIIFFFLCNHKKVDASYGELTTYHLLTGSEKSLKDVANFLKEKYASRGFDELVPIISEKIAELELSLHQLA